MVRQAVTDIIEDFRTSVQSITCQGYTSLWDALALAAEQISSYGEKFPDARKRIICLSDGEDTKSTHTAQEICLSLQVHLH
jgi:Mg-chelatase subunit ChlD